MMPCEPLTAVDAALSAHEMHEKTAGRKHGPFLAPGRQPLTTICPLPGQSVVSAQASSRALQKGQLCANWGRPSEEAKGFLHRTTVPCSPLAQIPWLCAQLQVSCAFVTLAGAALWGCDLVGAEERCCCV